MARKLRKGPKKGIQPPSDSQAPTLETMDGSTRASFLKLMESGFRFDAYLDPEQFRRIRTESLRPRSYIALLVNLMAMATIDLAVELSEIPFPTVEVWVRISRTSKMPVWQEFGYNYHRANALFESNLNLKMKKAADGGNIQAIKMLLQWRNRERYGEKGGTQTGLEPEGAAIIGPRTVRLVKVTPAGNQLVATIGDEPIDVTPERNGKPRYPVNGRYRKDDDEQG